MFPFVVKLSRNSDKISSNLNIKITTFADVLSILGEKSKKSKTNLNVNCWTIWCYCLGLSDENYVNLVDLVKTLKPFQRVFTFKIGFDTSENEPFDVTCKFPIASKRIYMHYMQEHRISMCLAN